MYIIAYVADFVRTQVDFYTGASMPSCLKKALPLSQFRQVFAGPQ